MVFCDGARDFGARALLTMGESWHNNHHAFPESARLGLGRDEWDVGRWVLRGLGRIGLVTKTATPETRPERVELPKK